MRLGRHQEALLIRASRPRARGMVSLPILNRNIMNDSDVLHVMSERQVERIADRLVELRLLERVNPRSYRRVYRLTAEGRGALGPP